MLKLNKIYTLCIYCKQFLTANFEEVSGTLFSLFIVHFELFPPTRHNCITYSCIYYIDISIGYAIFSINQLTDNDTVDVFLFEVPIPVSNKTFRVHNSLWESLLFQLNNLFSAISFSHLN